MLTEHLILVAANPQFHMQQQQQQQILQQQRQQAMAARSAMLQQQYSGAGIPMNAQNSMGGMTQAQYQAMRGGPMARSVNLPQHLQQQQQQAQHSLEQQQAQQAQQVSIVFSFVSESFDQSPLVSGLWLMRPAPTAATLNGTTNGDAKCAGSRRK